MGGETWVGGDSEGGVKDVSLRVPQGLPQVQPLARTAPRTLENTLLAFAGLLYRIYSKEQAKGKDA